MSISSYINTTFTVTFARPLPDGDATKTTTTRDAALALLHDHPTVVTLSPLVTRYERVNDDGDDNNGGAAAKNNSNNNNKETYLVWETISYLPGTHLWDSELGIRAEFEDTADGTKAAVTAPLGFRSRFEWRIVRDEEGGSGWRAEESVTATCPWGLRWFVEGTMRRAHEIILGRFVERVGEAVRAGRDE